MCALNAWANKGCEIYVICEIRGYISACIYIKICYKNVVAIHTLLYACTYEMGFLSIFFFTTIYGMEAEFYYKYTGYYSWIDELLLFVIIICRTSMQFLFPWANVDFCYNFFYFIQSWSWSVFKTAFLEQKKLKIFFCISNRDDKKRTVRIPHNLLN